MAKNKDTANTSSATSAEVTGMRAARIGGFFAPPIDDEKLEVYRDLAHTAPSPAISEAMLKLCDMVEVFNQTPPSTLTGEKHPSGLGMVVPLEDQEVRRIDEYVPWQHEIESLIGVSKNGTYVAGLFDQLPTGQKGSEENNRRNAAYHLAWYAVELCKDREPMVTTRLNG